MAGETKTIPDQIKEHSLIAIKAAELIRNGLNEKELKMLVCGDGMWLVMQMLCSPSGAASIVYRSSINSFFSRA
ncbi:MULTISPECIES: hypothetical protein [unclassified Serratia (in: enterobacteria)]|uniref:hypothetical protein n=1 Tax=unclassified Serratia (in: enterobacteria) TaxID=2647522 RepID=UPI0012FEB6BD|nr:MULTISPECIES: hypothetical protein [unclassified Serratia (in: enterobacteria)]